MVDNSNSAAARQAYTQHSCQPAGIWTLTLNRYQRDNLLFLLNVCGFPAENQHANPSMDFNTGAWMGEIANALSKVVASSGPHGHNSSPATCIIDNDDSPNATPQRLAPADDHHDFVAKVAPTPTAVCATCDGLGSVPHMAFKRTKFGSNVLLAEPLQCPDCDGTGGSGPDHDAHEHGPHTALGPGDVICGVCGGNGFTPHMSFKRTKFGSTVLSATPVTCTACHGVGHVNTTPRQPLEAPRPSSVNVVDDSAHHVCPVCATVSPLPGSHH